MGSHGFKIQKNSVRVRGEGMVVQVDVLLHREFADGAIAHALFGDESQSRRHALIDRGRGDLLAAKHDLPAGHLADTGQALGQFALAIA